MNNAIEVKIGSGFEAEAIQILREIPELVVTMDRDREIQSDAVLRGPGLEIPVAIEFKARLNSAGAHQVANYAERFNMPIVVVAGETTSEAREILAGAGIGVVDGLGNLRLELPGLLMRITGTKKVRRSPSPVRLSGKSGLVVQAMLLDVERIWKIPDLAQHCGVSIGLVHKVLGRLEGEEVLDVRGAGPRKTRQVANPTALLDLWAEEHRDRLARRPAFMIAQTSDQLINDLCRGLESVGADYALTGSAAAVRIAPYISNVLVAEVWIASKVDTDAVCAQIDAMPVESGPNVVFLRERNDTPLAFRTRTDNVWTANIFRLYFDLLRDPQRGQEQAEHLRREAIGF